MSPANKGNAEILADPGSFRQAVAHAREKFGKIKGVVSVGMGQKETGARYKDDIAIVFFVREKKKEAELSPEERIPDVFEGYLTDVRTVRKAAFHACDNTAVYDTIQGGIQITGPMNGITGQFHAGTLSAIVKRRNNSDRDNVYLLTNKHVLFIDASKAGEYVYHPFCPTPNKNFVAPGPSNTLGPIQPENEVIDLQLNGVNTITDVRSVIGDPSILNQKVFKVGRTTGKTVGIVRHTDAAVDVPPDPDPTISGSTGFSGLNTIEIDFDTTSAAGGVNCKGNARFCEQGDSGALILDEQGRVIGLHSLGAPPGSPSAFPSNACHILPVLDQLKICIPVTTGTSRGCCGATDGTGVEPAPMGDFPLSDGTIDFASQGATQPLTGVSAPTSDEFDHLQEVLSNFRSTSLGCELHELFGNVRREIAYLVRNCRPVKVAWARNKGPVFFAHFLNHLKGSTPSVPREVDGVTRGALFKKMLNVLSVNGSAPLRRAIEEHGDYLASIMAGKDTVDQCIAYMHERGSA